MTTSAYQPLTTREMLFRDLVWTPALEAGEASLFTAAPILAAPVLNEIDTAVIGALADWLFEQIRLVVDIEAIRLVNSEHQKAFDGASVRLKIVALESGDDSPEFKKAIEDEKLAFAKFVGFGAAP